MSKPLWSRSINLLNQITCWIHSFVFWFSCYWLRHGQLVGMILGKLKEKRLDLWGIWFLHGLFAGDESSRQGVWHCADYSAGKERSRCLLWY
jgi:hypothetical protein